MAFKGWNYFVLKNHAGDSAPKEWIILLPKLKTIISNKIINKVESAAFSAKGERKARWKLPEDNPEFCSKVESFKVAKKLIFLVLNCENGPGIIKEIRKEFPKDEFVVSTTKCPLCKSTIELSDFERDGRKDPYSIQLGHDIPLSRRLGSHNHKNIFWIHRRCNYVKGEQTLSESLLNLVEIIKNHLIV